MHVLCKADLTLIIGLFLRNQPILGQCEGVPVVYQVVFDLVGHNQSRLNFFVIKGHSSGEDGGEWAPWPEENGIPLHSSSNVREIPRKIVSARPEKM